MASWQRYPGAQLGPPGASWAAQQQPTRSGDHSRASAPPPSPFQAQQHERDSTNAHANQIPDFPPQNNSNNYGTTNPLQYNARSNEPGFGGPYRQPGVQSTAVRGEWVSLNGPWTGHHHQRGPWHHGPRRSQPGFLVATLRLCVYHVANVVFSLVACGVLSAGVCAAVSLIPVCCVGLLIFQVLVYIVFALAQWDIRLGNYVASTHQFATPSLLLRRHVGSGYHIAPGLAYFSPLSLMALLYFLLVKPVLGCLSLLAVLLVVAPPVSLLTTAMSLYHGDDNSIDFYGMDSTRYPGLSLVAAMCVVLTGIALMQLMAKISLGATRFFCCEKVAMTPNFADA